MYTKRNVISVILAAAILLITAMPARAATPEEIQASIDAGIEWLVAQQGGDGSWSGCVARTGFAVIKLQERAYELGLDPFETDPMDPNYYEYAANVVDGWEYLFTASGSYVGAHARKRTISAQTHGDPDSNGNGYGISFRDESYHTGICLMALAASRAPDRINDGGLDYDGDGNPDTLAEIAQEVVDWLAYGQVDSGSREGAWGYSANSSGDNSVTGYAVLGLSYAKAPLFGFNCTVPDFVENELNIWVDYIQCKTAGPNYGGSGYTSPSNWVNILKTGNLIFEMTYLGDPPEAQRLQDALDYIGNTWNDPSVDPGWKGPPPHYQAMYCVMKGLTYAGIETIDVSGTPVNWYDEFADAIVSNQQGSGAWPSDYWGGPILATEWALLTLEAIAPPQPEPFGQWVYQCSDFEAMDLDDYVTGGTPPYTWTHDPPDNVTLDIDLGNVLTIDYDHNWYGEDVVLFTVTDSYGFSADVYATFTVIGVPVVDDIPDQTMPFVSYDLDDYLSQMAPEDVEWVASDPGGGWTVDIDPDNVVTVTSPEGATDPVTITFTAINAVCPEWWLALGNEAPLGSDDATFIPNQPPDCDDAYADPDCLWPPNHKFVPVNILGVTDPDGDDITITITSVTSDEPTASDEGSGGAKHAPDASGAGTDTAWLRAERSGDGNGRVYEISFTASDGKGGECECSVTVCVPHDQGQGDECIDDGQDYDATQIN